MLVVMDLLLINHILEGTFNSESNKKTQRNYLDYLEIHKELWLSNKYLFTDNKMIAGHYYYEAFIE